jgi:hypothetical protein
MFDYIIRDPSPLLYHLGFMVGLLEGGRLASSSELSFCFGKGEYIFHA